MKLYALGIDLGKTVFHLVGLDESGQVMIRKRCSRTQLPRNQATRRSDFAMPRLCAGRIQNRLLPIRFETPLRIR